MVAKELGDGAACSATADGATLLRRAEEAKENENALVSRSGRRARFKQWLAAPRWLRCVARVVRRPATGVLHVAFNLCCRSEL